MLNRVILMGRLTSDPEHKQTQNGISFTRFSIAVQRNFGDKNGNRETDFINIVAWRQTADFICRFFSKGRMIAIDGAIQTSSYEDKNTGAKRTSFEVVAESAHFADSKPEGNQGGSYNNFPVPEAPPERPNNSFPGDMQFGEPQFATPKPQSAPAPSAQPADSGFSVGDFFEATDDDDDDFPY